MNTAPPLTDRADFAVVDTPLGPFTVVGRDGAVVAAGFGTGVDEFLPLVSNATRPTELRERAELGVLTRAVADYFAGDVTALDAVEVHQRSGAFRERAWAELRAIPAGTTISYGELAKRADSPRAVRAAGQACARNAACLYVPCHRVVAADGKAHHYAYGVDRKRTLIAHESGQLRLT